MTILAARCSALSLVVTVLAALVSPGTTHAQDATFHGLEGTTPVWDRTFGIGLSPNGRAVCGKAGSGVQEAGFLWTSRNGIVALEDLQAGDRSAAADASDNAVVVGEAFLGSEYRAVRWTEEGIEDLGALDGKRSRALAVSADGSSVVGVSTQFPWEAFLWTAGGGMIGLGHLPGGIEWSEAHGISADSSIIVGWSITGSGFHEAFRYENGAMHGIGFADGDNLSKAFGISPDGFAIVGSSWRHSQSAEQACLWRAGLATKLGVLPGGDWSTAHAVSDGGSRVVGVSDVSAPSPAAFVWDEATGMRDLKEVLENDFGLDLTGWELRFAQDISRDGTRIVGSGINPDGEWEAWLACMPGCSDRDGDGLLDSWESDGLDVNGDGIVDLDLPAMGADPDRKDLFIEIDVMQNVMFSQAGLDLVTEAFANAPLSNPDGTFGITLHNEVDETDLALVSDLNTSLADLDMIKDAHFGTEDERQSANWVPIRSARELTFRYCLVAFSIAAIEEGQPAGLAEMPGNDFVIGMKEPGAASDRSFAIVYMHELGHNLGLDHGGDDAINYKPNYISAMNYNFSTQSGPNGKGLAPLDFSRDGTSPPLDESDLSDLDGYESHGYPQYVGFYSYWSAYWNERLMAAVEMTGEPHDWDQDNEVDVHQCIDLNNFGETIDGYDGVKGETLCTYNDWELMKLPIGVGGDFENGVHQTVDRPELTHEILAWQRENIPPLPVNVAEITNVHAIRGTIVYGSADSIIGSDAEALVIRAVHNRIPTDITDSNPGASVEVLVAAVTDVMDAETIDLLIEAGIRGGAQPGDLRRRPWTSELWLRNWSSGTFDVVDVEIGHGAQSVVRDLDAARYVDPDGRIDLVIRHELGSPAPRFESHVDYVQITVSR